MQIFWHQSTVHLITHSSTTVMFGTPNTVLQLTKEAADFNSTTWCLASVVSSLLSSRVNDWRLHCRNDVFTNLWWSILHKLTCLLSSLHQTPRHPLRSCSSHRPIHKFISHLKILWHFSTTSYALPVYTQNSIQGVSSFSTLIFQKNYANP